MHNGKTYQGTQPLIINPTIFRKTQELLNRSNKPKYRKYEFAFSGLLNCAYDNCAVTAEIKKNRYIYYRGTGFRGKCELPYMREEHISERLGQILKNIQIPDPVLLELQNSLSSDAGRMQHTNREQQRRLEQRLASIRRKLELAYTDKLEGRISEEFWATRNAEWLSEENQVRLAFQALGQANPDRLLTANRALDLANKAYSLYVRQNPAEQGKLLKLVLSNCAVDSASLYRYTESPST